MKQFKQFIFWMVFILVSSTMVLSSCNETKDEPEPETTIDTTDSIDTTTDNTNVFNPNITYGTVTDIEGNTYKTVTIGTQTWMAENLKVTKYKDGTAIPKVTDDTEWSNLNTGAYCCYNNDDSNASKYGLLYNWYAVFYGGKLAPQGWHVPSESDWIILENYLIANGYNYDGTTTDNKFAKSLASTTEWDTSTNIGAIGNDLTVNNSTGFSAIPSGRRSPSGFFDDLGKNAYWWTTSQSTPGYSWYRDLFYAYYKLRSLDVTEEYGYSVRCIKD